MNTRFFLLMLCAATGCAGASGPSPLVARAERAKTTAADVQVTAEKTESAIALRELRKAGAWIEKGSASIEDEPELATLLIETAEGAIARAKTALVLAEAEARLEALKSLAGQNSEPAAREPAAHPVPR